MDQNHLNNFGKGPPKDHLCEIISKLGQEFKRSCQLSQKLTDVRPILNIGPVYKGPLIRSQVSEITGQFSSELARKYQTDKLLRAISSLDVHHHRHKMALFKKFILLPALRSPESFEATYRGPWPLVKKWPLVYLQTTKKAPKSISVARTDDGQRPITKAHLVTS